MIWKSSSAPRGSRWTWPTSSSYAGAEAYVRERDIADLQHRFGLSKVARRDANAHLHVVADRAGEWLFSLGIAPAAVVAVDLLERGESRTEIAGAKLAMNV